eukprot:6489294-Amphidinium_carterae.1
MVPMLLLSLIKVAPDICHACLQSLKACLGGSSSGILDVPIQPELLHNIHAMNKKPWKVS